MESPTVTPVRRSGRTPGTNPVIQWVCVAALLVLAWGAFALLVAPRPVPLGNGTLFTVGLAVTAFLLGVRHAFDADHIAAIDNATRRLQTLGHPGHAVGFWFALGHSTIVLAAVLALSAGLTVLARQLGRDDSTFATVTGLWGATFSGLFLVVIGIVNAVALVRVLRAREDAAPRGPMTLLFGRAGRLVTRPSRMFVVGLLFGLGFDTATTIGLFVVAGGAVTVSWWVALVLPLLFTAGMVLFDSLNGTLMRSAYRWAGDAPRRRRTYDAVMLSLSVVVALTVGTVALAGALTDGLGLGGGVVAWWGGLDIADGGIVILATFLGLWGVMTLVDRARRHPA